MPVSVLATALIILYATVSVLYTYSTLSAGQRLAVGSVQSVQLIMYAAIKTNIFISRDHIGKSGKSREVNRECSPLT